MSRELLKRALDFMEVVGCSNDDICQLCDEIQDELAKPEFEYEEVGEIDALSYENQTLYSDSIKPLNHRFDELIGSALYIRTEINQSTPQHQTHSEQS